MTGNIALAIGASVELLTALGLLVVADRLLNFTSDDSRNLVAEILFYFVCAISIVLIFFGVYGIATL